MGSAGHWVAECRPGSSSARILRMDPLGLGETGELREIAPSLADLLEVWLGALLRRQIAYHPDQGWGVAAGLDHATVRALRHSL